MPAFTLLLALLASAAHAGGNPRDCDLENFTRIAEQRRSTAAGLASFPLSEASLTRNEKKIGQLSHVPAPATALGKDLDSELARLQGIAAPKHEPLYSGPVRESDGIGSGKSIAVFASGWAAPTEADVSAVEAAVKQLHVTEVLILPGKGENGRALAALAFARLPEARLPSAKLSAELAAKEAGSAVELLAARNHGRTVTSLAPETAVKDPRFGALKGENIRYALVGKAGDQNSELIDDFVHAKGLSAKVDHLAASGDATSLAPGVADFLEHRRAPASIGAVTKAELAATEKDPASLARLSEKLRAARTDSPLATLTANRDSASRVATNFDALARAAKPEEQAALRAQAASAREAARWHEAARLEKEIAARPAAISAIPTARAEKPIKEMLREQATRGEVPIRSFNADVNNKFPAEFEGRLKEKMNGKNLVVLGAGSNLYNGFLSVKYRLSYLMGVKGELEKGFYLFDPGFLERDAMGILRVKAEARAAHPNATILTSMSELPEKSVVIGLTPNSVHQQNIAELAGNARVAGIYMEKPIATSEAELGLIKKSEDASTTPTYFGDHYLHAGGGILSAMGVPSAGKSALEITYDPTGALAKALEHGEPTLKNVTHVEGHNFQEGRGLEERPRLRLLSAGGGVGPDLQVHLTNVTHALGYDFKAVDKVEEWVYSANAPGKGEFVPIAQAHTASPDSAADYRVITGSTTGGATYRIESAQFKPAAENYLLLTGDGGRKLRVDFESGLTELFDEKGEKIGEMRQRGDAYLLTMNDALELILSGEPEAFQLSQQSASVREAIQSAR